MLCEEKNIPYLFAPKADLGQAVGIHVPTAAGAVVVEGKAKDIKLPDNIQSFVIPITWKDNKSFLVVCLE